MRLHPHARLRVEYRDDTPLGSAVSTRCDDVLRAACPAIVELWSSHGIAEVVRQGEALIAAGRAQATGLGAYYLDDEHLHPAFLHPDAALVVPECLSLTLGGADAPTQHALVPELARWLGDWQHEARRPASGAARALFDGLESSGAFVDAPRAARPPLGEVTFVGHACVRFAPADGRPGSVLVDPWLMPPHPNYPATYQPLDLDALGPVRGVLITHAHPDHFDLGTLLRLGADTPIVVPRVSRETVLAIDMAHRLGELGFTDVRTPAWGERELVAGLSVQVRPFYGEQPATDAVLHPEVRNCGNTYVVEAPYGRFALTVDSGRDPLGDARRLAVDARAELGPVDVVFGGCRGFGLYPVHYLFSSVARYLPFVPRPYWGQRQRIMNDADDALDVAELWGASVMVPYADGGAPWYWEHGLGPRLDGRHTPIASVDPAPEHALLARMLRSGSSKGAIASPVRVEVLRPNDGWSQVDGQRVRMRPAPWPYPPVPGLPVPD